MDLYLIRHAEAVALGERGVTTDEDRPLSERGEQEAQAAARTLKKRGMAFDRLYTSPLLRARQTADILHQVWGRADLAVETCEYLAPDVKPRKLARFLLKQGGERVALVGHMPHLAVFAGWLIGEKKVQIDMAKAGVACIECGEVPGKDHGTLQWLVTPEWFD